MQVRLSNLGKRFNNDWIFKNLNYTFESRESYAITGHNGSGKSTLLSLISSYRLPDQGEITYTHSDQNISPDSVFSKVTICGPHVELVEEFTVHEALKFHSSFKKWRGGLDNQSVFELLELPGGKRRFIKSFSSGMKQKLKLGLALFSQSPLLLLDEPTSNLDSNNKAWYLKHVQSVLEEKTVLIFSNAKEEFEFAQKTLNLSDFKNSR